jgi:hypothetical protein
MMTLSYVMLGMGVQAGITASLSRLDIIMLSAGQQAVASVVFILIGAIAGLLQR